MKLSENLNLLAHPAADLHDRSYAVKVDEFTAIGASRK